MSTQDENLNRVSTNIADRIIQFMDKPVGTRFYAEDLRRFVCESNAIAPASADRVLRNLRQQRKLNYRVISRASSLYEVSNVA